MDKVLERIEQINSTAAGIMEETARKKAEMDADMDRRTRDFDRKLHQDTELRLETLRRQLQGKLEEELSGLRADTASELSALEETYRARHGAIALRLVDEMTRE